MCVMQFDLFGNAVGTSKAPIELGDLFEAYFACRRNKRNTVNALAFEVEYETNLVKLCDEINSGAYRPGKSIAFVVDKPVVREIFAADFRDRVVHHLIIHKLNSLFEKQFIYDSYACRANKGTHLGIRRVNRFIAQCSQNYHSDCYVLKLDIKGFFMHINKDILFDKLTAFVNQHYTQADKDALVDLCEKVIFNDPTQNCIIKGDRRDWAALPADKSLFHSPHHCGLSIGNLTSQVLANFYMNGFDHFVKHNLGVRFYGRYVDDFVIVHHDREYLRSIVSVLSSFLSSTLKLTLHPHKVYLQHYTKGVKYLGVVIKPHRIYIANRTKGNFYEAIHNQNLVARDHKPNREERRAFLSSMNSYLGMMKHYRTYRLRKRMITRNLSGWWWNHVHMCGGYTKSAEK